MPKKVSPRLPVSKAAPKKKFAPGKKITRRAPKKAAPKAPSNPAKTSHRGIPAAKRGKQPRSAIRDGPSTAKPASKPRKFAAGKKLNARGR